jgi:UDP-glucose 4-epimerase
LKTVLLIGSSGFLGSHLRKRLKKTYKLICVNREKKFDIRDFNKVKILLNRKIDFIINLSGQVSNKKNMFNTIVRGNENIINAIKNRKIKPIVYFISTTLVYGFSNKLLNERSKLAPSLNYSKIKKISELHYLKSNLNFKILRVANVYSSKKNGIIKYLINCFLSKKKLNVTNIKSYRNYIHVDDFTNIINKMLRKKLNHNIYNLGHENFSIQGLIKIIETKFKNKLNYINKNYKLSAISSHKISNPRLLSEIKYSPQVKMKKFLIKEIQNET